MIKRKATITIITLVCCILATANVLAEEPFNLEVEVPETYEEVLVGENMWFTSKLINLANKERIDVVLKYDILDSNRQLKATKSETVAIETQASFVGTLRIPKNVDKGLHFLRVTVISPYGESEAETSFNIIKEETKAWVVIKFSLFDIEVTIPDDYKIISPGDELLTSIKLINVGSQGRVDVFLDYWIVDENNNTILKKKETVAIETQANFVRTFDIPQDTKPGTYEIYAKITYADGKLAITNHSFEIEKKEVNLEIYYIVGSIILLGLLIYLISKSKPLIKKMQMKMRVWRIVKRKHLEEQNKE